MPDIPAEAVKASLIMTADDMWADWKRGGKVVVQVVADDAAEAIVRALAAHAGVGSPVSCPSAAPESTQSPESPSVAPVYPPGVERPAESLSAPRGEDAHPLASSHAREHADDELTRLRQEVEQLRVAVNPTKAGAVKSLVSSATRLVRLERDDARAAIARVRAALAKPVMCGPNAIPSVPVATIHAALDGTKEADRG